MSLPQFGRYPRVVAALLVLIASIRIVATYKVLNHTTDEPAHLAAGMEWLQGGTYTYEDQHPPLARVLGASGLYIAGSRWAHGPDMYKEGYRLLGQGQRYTHNLFYSRLAMLPLFWIACAVVFLWTVRLSGPLEGVLAVLVFSLIPPILGHAGLATTDMALTALTGGAALTALYWAEQPDWKRSAAFGLALSLAVLSKFSALLFLPAGMTGVYLVYVAQNRPGLRKAVRDVATRMPPALVSILVCAGVVATAYRFSFGAVPYLHARLPAPEFFNGIHAVWEHNKEGHPAWLLGRRSQRGFWYYYLVVAGVKTPLAVIVLIVIALVRGGRRAAAPLAFSAAILVAASFGNINIGIRHILPVYIGMSIACGMAALQLFRAGLASRVVASLLLSWLLISAARIHPDYIAYTNEIAGDRPDRILADSDLDWGQDMRRLAARMRELGVHEFTFKISSAGYLAAGNDFPRFVQMPDGDRPRAGWNAVSITPWRISGQPRWAETAEPTERIGRSILLYYFPEKQPAVSPPEAQSLLPEADHSRGIATPSALPRR